MSGSVTYAAAVSTPNGRIQQPQIEARACSQDDPRAWHEAQPKPQRPGVGIRAKTSFRGWSKKSEKGDRPIAHYQPGPVQEVQKPAHHPREEHRPNTGNSEGDVYVLTLQLTDSIARPMNKMREEYFPKRLNRTPAHLTLFHALPHSHMEELQSALSQVAASIQPFDVSTGKPFRMRKGVGINVDSGYRRMKDVHEQLQSQWLPFLSEQDAGGFRPHWTAMNKVDDENKVDDAFETIKRELSAQNQEGQALGLELWRYDRGHWEWANVYPFGESSSKVQAQSSSSTREQGSPSKDIPDEQSPGGPNKRPGMWKRGSSVGDALRSMSFRRKS
ncbi:hypothetical protein ACN47E_003803 [Coniothyrium glycines]